MNNEPVAWINKVTFQYLTELGYSAKVYPKKSDGDIPLYTHPVKELTDGQIMQVWWDANDITDDDTVIEFARAILRKAQEK